MSFLEAFSGIGEKLANFLGDPTKCSGSNSKDLTDYVVSDTCASLLPWETYDPETQLFFSKDSVGFAIEALPMVGADDSCQKEITSIVEEVMQEGSSLQCLLFADFRVGGFLQKWTSARAQSQELIQESVHRRAEKLKSSTKFPSRIFRFVMSYSVPLSQISDEKNIEELVHLRELVLKTLRQMTGAFCWDADDLVKFADGMINFTKDPNASSRRFRPNELISSQIPSGGVIDIQEDRLSWGTRSPHSFRSFRVVDYPDTWSLSAMTELIGSLYKDSHRLEFPFVIQYAVHCPKQSSAERSFRSRMYIVENQGKSGALLRMIPDLAEELRELDFIRRSIRESRRFVWTQLSVGVWSQDGNIHKTESQLRSLFRMNHFTLAECRCLHLPQFLGFLPMSWAEYVDDFRNLNLLKTTISSECANLVPIQGEWMGTANPGMLLVGRRGQLMNWNPFDNPRGNYNVVVAGRSGSGKSVFMQDLIVSGLGVGKRVFVLEVGRSFAKTCDFLSGQYIEFTSNAQLCLNPFTHISNERPQERDQSLAMLKPIVACMAAPTRGTDDYENAIIEKAIRCAWEAKGSKATITDISLWLQEQSDSRAQSLGVMLTPYSRGGAHSRYFEGENNVNFNKDLVLVELEELKDKKDLQSVVMQMFIMTITNQTFFGDRTTPFHICIDEAWDLLRGKQTGEFIETLARRLRKYNGSLIIGTQSIDDFYSTPGALAAYENSDWTCLFSQRKDSIQRFAESGKVAMTEAKRLALESVKTRHGEYSEVMICDGEGSYSIGRLILDDFSLLLYSSQAEEYAKVKRLQNQGLSVSEAIKEVLAGAKSH